MFGHAPFIGVFDFCEGAGVAGVVGVLGVVLAGGAAVVGVELVGAAAAPAIPATAPPAASAPNTIAALRVFEMCICGASSRSVQECYEHYPSRLLSARRGGA